MKRITVFLLATMFAAGGALAEPPSGKDIRKIVLQPQVDTLSVDVLLPGFDGAVSLTLPELVNDDTRRIIYTDSNLKSVHWEKTPKGALKSQWSLEGVGGYEIEATPQKDGVAIRWLITNYSAGSWIDTAGNICMRSKTIPGFFNPEGDRIFLRAQDKWVSVRDANEQGSVWYLAEGKEPASIMQPHLDDHSYRIARLRPSEAIIAVQSNDGQYVLAQAWKESRYILGNVHPHYVCTEAPPAFGTVGPGESVEIKGMIYFLKGDLAALLDKYHHDLKKRKISIQR